MIYFYNETVWNSVLNGWVFLVWHVIGAKISVGSAGTVHYFIPSPVAKGVGRWFDRGWGFHVFLGSPIDSNGKRTSDYSNKSLRQDQLHQLCVFNEFEHEKIF